MTEPVMSKGRLMGLTIASAIGLVILLALGSWQLNRLAWKQDIIATIAARTAAAPVPLPRGTAIDPDEWQYRRVTVRGRFLNDKEMHILAHTARGNLGFNLIVPMEREDGGYVLVNRGWVPQGKKPQSARPESIETGTVTIDGIVQKGWPQALFVPDTDFVQNIWFFGDIPGMAAHAGGLSVPPIFVESVPYADPQKLPLGGQTKLNIPNDHLQYAITWYSLAAVLVVFYILIYRRRAI